MGPCFFNINTTYIGLSNAELFCNFGLWKLLFKKLKNFLYLIFSKLAFPVLRAKATSPATFIHHVVNIFFLCSKPKMINVYTRSIITSMKHIKTFGYFSFKHYPYSAMCSNSSSVERKCPISKMILRSGPFPTIFCFINFLHKLINHPSCMQGALQGVK